MRNLAFNFQDFLQREKDKIDKKFEKKLLWL